MIGVPHPPSADTSPVPCIPLPLLPCPTPAAPPASPVPGTIPTIAPTVSSSPPAPATSPAPAGGGSLGIGSAYPPSPTPGALATPPPSPAGTTGIFTIVQERGTTGTDPTVYLLAGLVLITVGVGLVAIRHRREALSIAAMERTKTDFLNLASHELRGPLTVLKGYLSIAQDGGMGKMPPRFASALPTLEAKVSEMEVLVDQMVEAARLEAGRPELKLSDGDLRDVVREAVPFTLWDAPASAFRMDLGPLPVIVRLDDYRMRTLVAHLFDNAIKYSPDGIDVAVTVTRDGNRALVKISDRGVGISSENFTKLFTRFGRIPHERTTGVQGLGLGLYLSKQVAQLHGGDLTAESEPGKGTTFTLSLPLAETQAERGRAHFTRRPA